MAEGTGSAQLEKRRLRGEFIGVLNILVRGRGRAAPICSTLVTVTEPEGRAGAISGVELGGYQERVLSPERGQALTSLPREWEQLQGCQSSRKAWTAL